LLKRAVSVFLTTVVFIFIYTILGTDTASAEEPPTVQVTPAPESVTSQPDTATVVAATLAAVETKVDGATATVEAAVTTLTEATTTVAPVVAETREVVAAVETAQTAITEAQNAVVAADSATAVAVTATAAVESQTAVVATATTAVESQTAVVAVATAAVESQTAVVAVATTNLTNAQTTLTELQNTPSDSKTYTTEGYVAPEPVVTPTVTTTTLPVMYDGSTKIQTPFDIKMGNTVYNGQGADSQIYVTSKATITFGTGDHIWWDFPGGPSISVFASDYMNAGAGTSTVVTTTDTTLEVDWNLKKFGDNNSPITNVNWKMTVNPTTGEWTGVGTVAGNTTDLYYPQRTGVREVAGEPVQTMTNVTNETLTAQIESQTAVVADKTEVKAVEVAVLATLTEEKSTAVTALAEVQTTLTAETQTLTTLQSTQEVAVATASTLADVAVAKAEVRSLLPQSLLPLP